MANYNKIILVGNLTRDVQIRNLPSGSTVADFGLAVNEKYRTKSGEDREEVLFIDCACFGKGAEILGQYARKGKQLLVDGKLSLQTWEDKQGNKRSKHVVKVDNFQFLGGPRDDGGRPAANNEEEEPNFDDAPF